VHATATPEPYPLSLHDALPISPGAGKWYKTNGKSAFQHIQIRLKDNAIFEWLPQETMLFNGAHAHSETSIHLDKAASFIGWDMRSEEHTSELQSRFDLVCRLLL